MPCVFNVLWLFYFVFMHCEVKISLWLWFFKVDDCVNQHKITNIVILLLDKMKIPDVLDIIFPHVDI